MDTSDAGFLKDTSGMGITGQGFMPGLNKKSSDDALVANDKVKEGDDLRSEPILVGPQYSTGSNSTNQLPGLRLKNFKQDSLSVVEEEQVAAKDNFISQADSKRSKLARILCCFKKSKERHSTLSLHDGEDAD